MFLSFNATQWVFTTVSLANLLCFFLLGSGPVGCLLCCLSNGETQIWLGDLRLALVSLVCVLLVFAIMICQASCDHRHPCRSFLTNSFDSCQDRALERDRPHRRKKKMNKPSRLDDIPSLVHSITSKRKVPLSLIETLRGRLLYAAGL